jgi:hypothetical protein
MSTPLSAETFRPLDDQDPATPGDPTTRLRYRYGQLLGAEDFLTEQRYFLLRSRLHNALLHGWGTVWGLAVSHEAKDQTQRLACSAGLAIDALGREILVPETLCVDIAHLPGTELWKQLEAPGTDGPSRGVREALRDVPRPDRPAAARDTGTDAAGPSDADAGSGPTEDAGAAPPEDDGTRRLYVVLRYRAALTEPAPSITPPCGDGADGLEPSRIHDGYQLCLEPEEPAAPFPPQRDLADLNAAAKKALAGHPGGAWGPWPHPGLARGALLDFILAGPPTLPRFWSGDDEAPLLLATVDVHLGDPGPDGQRAVSVAVVNNAVRALLPPVQALGSLLLDDLLDRAPGTAVFGQPLGRRFQVLGHRVAPGTDADEGLMVVRVRTTTALSQEGLDALPDTAVRALTLAEDGTWQAVEVKQLRVPAPASADSGFRLECLLGDLWETRTTYQLCLSGTGADALTDGEGRVLAGMAAEAVPPGVGRDLCLTGIYTPESDGD